MSEGLYAGKRCLYRFTPRGGYGYTMRVPVVVLGYSGHFVRVRVEKNGEELSIRRSSLIEPPSMRDVVAHIDNANEQAPA
jgi:hypothetical protein